MNVKDIILDQLNWTRQTTLSTFAEFDVGQRFFQAAPGVNHPLWLLGHIAGSEDRLLLQHCTGRSLVPPEYAKLFGIKSTPLADPAAYPSGEEILETLARIHQAALDFVRGATEADLAQPPVGFDQMPDRAKQLFPSRLRCAWFHANHEAMHSGQLGYIRRLLGKPYRI
jgi:hypothetical protein